MKYQIDFSVLFYMKHRIFYHIFSLDILKWQTGTIRLFLRKKVFFFIFILSLHYTVLRTKMQESRWHYMRTVNNGLVSVDFLLYYYYWRDCGLLNTDVHHAITNLKKKKKRKKKKEKTFQIIRYIQMEITTTMMAGMEDNDFNDDEKHGRE